MSLIGCKFSPLPFLLLLVPALAVAQPQHQGFMRLGTKEGLRQVSVYTITQDAQGFVWMGTQTGLHRFDGNKFEVFTSSKRNPESLSNNWVQTLLSTEDGELWVGTRGGLDLYDPSTQSFHSYSHVAGDPTSLCNNSVRWLRKDKVGRLWIATLGGICYYQNGTFTTLTTRDGKDVDLVSQFLLDRDGNLWVATQLAGLFFVDLQSNPDKPFFLDPVPYIPQQEQPVPGELTAISQDQRGRIWLGSFSHGLYRIEENGKWRRIVVPPDDTAPVNLAVYSLFFEEDENLIWVGGHDQLVYINTENDQMSYFSHRPGTADGLLGSKIYAIFKDRDGELWLGSDGDSVAKLSINARIIHHYKHFADNPDSLSNNNVNGIFEDSKGRLWIGTDKGLNRQDPGSNAFKHYYADANNQGSIPHNEVMAIYEDQQNQIWVGFYLGGVGRYQPEDETFYTIVEDKHQPNGFSNWPVVAFLEDHRGNFWLGTRFGPVIMDRKTETFRYFSSEALGSIDQKFLLDMVQDENDNIWLASRGGLARYRWDENAFKVYNSNAEPHSLIHDLVMDLHLDSEGFLWVATGSGLCRMKDERFEVFGHAQGLPNETIYAIKEDDQKGIWISTNLGLARLDMETLRVDAYDTMDGLQSNEFNSLAAAKTSDGRLFFGGVNGYNQFYPHRLHVKDETPVPKLTNLRILNKLVPISSAPESILPKAISEVQSLKLKHTDYLVTLEFAALHYRNPTNNRFAYFLDGFDKDWIETSAERNSATYTGLDPGLYSFKVKSKTPRGVWGEAVSLDIIVAPPFWASKLAYVFYGLLLFLLVLYIERRRRLMIALNQRLIQADKLKDIFLANTSHELRTPLHGIIGIAESLRAGATGDLSEATNANLDMIVGTGRRLSNLVGDILDFTRIKGQELTLELSSLHLSSVCDAIVRLMMPLAEDKKLRLYSCVPQDLPPVLADENRLIQIFVNLIGNAIKFTNVGEVVISAQVIDDKIEIAIKDTGIGIAPEHQDSIFKSFEQADGSITREFGGTGLGLALTRRLVNLHGGTIRVESSILEGSTFFFTMPQGNRDELVKHLEHGPRITQIQVETTPMLTVQPRLLASGLLKGRILIVDDEAVNRQLLINHLSMVGYELVEAIDGMEALDILEEDDNTFDLVLLDVMMPGMPGYDVCTLIRETHSVTELPVIFLSARDRAEDLATGFEAGGNDYLVKPISRMELLARVELHLRLLNFSRDLESLVSERTKQLVELQGELVAEAHRAGMAEIAEDVLHGLGNAFNGVTTAVHNLNEVCERDKGLEIFRKLTELLEEQGSDLASFFANDPRAKDIPIALSRIHSRLCRFEETIDTSVKDLIERTGLARDILRHHHNFFEAKRPEVTCDINQLIEETLLGNRPLLEGKHVEVVFEKGVLPEITLQRGRFLRILTCILTNAWEAVLPYEGKIVVKTCADSAFIVVTLQDNGPGIDPTHLEQIYYQGFSTKEGHGGLGLHYCANALSAMNASIQVENREPGTLVTIQIPRTASR